jgi:hypothetical protein
MAYHSQIGGKNMNETANFDEFMDAFDNADDYQTDSDTEETETAEET